MTRLERLTGALGEAKLDAVALVPGANLLHLTGMPFHAGERLLMAVVTAKNGAAFVLPEMEALRVSGALGNEFALYPWNDGQPMQQALNRLCGDLQLAGARIAVEPLAMRVFELRALEVAAPGALFGDAGPVLAPLRYIKSAEELALMREAARMIDGSLESLLPKIRPGMTERQVASQWVIEILATGAEGAAFDLIVAAGPNSAFPHHTTSDRMLLEGDLVVLDGGARHGGYASDITRVVALGRASEQQRRIYEVVLDANSAGRHASRPGVTGADIDRAARAVIEEAGFGKQFLHRTGHGLGLDVHEPPYIAPDQHAPLPAGVVFTIEPGVYVQDVGGVRIEDDVVLTESGHESLTQFPRELRIL